MLLLLGSHPAYRITNDFIGTKISTGLGLAMTSNELTIQRLLHLYIQAYSIANDPI